MFSQHGKKRILIIAYYFPPDSTSGTYRSLKFARYLPLCGWEPVVLTVKDKYFLPTQARDHALLSKIPDQVTVARTRIFRPHEFLVNAKYALKSTLTRKSEIKDGLDRTGKQNSTGQGHAAKLKDMITDALSTPDEQIGWLPFAVRAGIAEIRRRGIDVIYSTGSPWTDHLIGYCLKKFTGVPWIADFRDPWVQNPWRRKKACGILQRVESLMERGVVSNADRIIANTDPLRECFEKTYKDLDPDRFTTITNGYDPEDYKNIRPGVEKEANVFTCTHLGSLYGERDIKGFLTAISRLVSSGKVDGTKIRINLVGKIDVHRLGQVQLIRELGIEQNVNLVGQVPHSEGLQYLAGSDALLLIQPGADLQIPGKLFEYIGMGKPILALTSGGATAELIRSHGLGLVVEPDDQEAIEDATYRLYKRFVDGSLETNISETAREKYSAIKLTEVLANVLDEAVLPR